MLEHQPVKTSRRWLWAVALIGAAVIPIQLVARTPEAPQGRAVKLVAVPHPEQEPEIYITNIQDGKTITLVEDKTFKRQVEKGRFFRTQQDVEEKLKLEKILAKAEQTFNEQTLREEFEKLIAAAEAASQADKALTYRDVIQKALQDQERRQVARRDEEELARGLQRLAERLERLAAEQRQLADELRRLQQQSPR